jgi:hypothetical protein
VKTSLVHTRDCEDTNTLVTNTLGDHSRVRFWGVNPWEKDTNRGSWVHILSLPIISCVTLDKSLNFSVLQNLGQ